MSILNRIIKLLGDADQKQLTDFLGLKKTAFTDWKNGKSNSYRKYLIEISKYFNVSIDYLVYGIEQNNELTDTEYKLISLFKTLSDKDKGRVLGKAETLAELAAEQMAEQNKEQRTEPCYPENKCMHSNNTCKIRYYDRPASAGTGLFLDEAIADTIIVRSTLEAQHADYAIPISGESVEDHYDAGEIVLVESCPCVRKGEVGIFLLDGSVYIKEFGDKRLISYNNEYPPMDLRKYETAACLGKVIGIAEIVS